MPNRSLWNNTTGSGWKRFRLGISDGIWRPAMNTLEMAPPGGGDPESSGSGRQCHPQRCNMGWRQRTSSGFMTWGNMHMCLVVPPLVPDPLVNRHAVFGTLEYSVQACFFISWAQSIDLTEHPPPYPKMAWPSIPFQDPNNENPIISHTNKKPLPKSQWRCLFHCPDLVIDLQIVQYLGNDVNDA